MGAAEFRHDAIARAVATLPGGLGGLGLRSAARTAQAAYWASWVDALPVLASKVPAVAARALNALTQAEGLAVSCMADAEASRQMLQEMGAAQIPSGDEALTGVDAPPREADTSDDDFARGWQCFASSVRETFFAERVIMSASDDSRRALLLSQGGSGAAWLRAIPSEPAFCIEPSRFQVAMRRRLRWPLPLSGGPCRGKSCRHKLDKRGDHAASCAVSGLLKLRSRPIEKIWVRVLREGRARVREDVLLRDTGVPVDPADRRAIEIVATGLPIAQGIPVAVDATMVSPLHADGTAHKDAASKIGVALKRAGKEARYLPRARRESTTATLTAAVEVGGRLSKDARHLLAELARSRSQSEPQTLRASVARSLRRRWLTMISVVCQDALAPPCLTTALPSSTRQLVPCRTAWIYGSTMGHN